jgi:hypothetical protein
MSREHENLSIEGIGDRSYAIELPADDKDVIPIELIRQIDSPNGFGPNNGIYALQKEFRKMIDGGLSWLSIKSKPSKSGTIPWFWCWTDCDYAIECDLAGRPFIQGPNTLFIYSGEPRIDKKECALLDAANCQMMFCHSEWYRDLIYKSRGPANKSSVVIWPYPINPCPHGPLPVKYDLLIYDKNGHHPQLPEYLAEAFPRNIRIKYGKYKREELYDAARKSRACAYLASDDHGPKALQEILLAGCPTIGVRTGAPYVLHGITGFMVDSIPSGLKRDEPVLKNFIDAINIAQGIDRNLVRTIALEQFDMNRIVDLVLTSLRRISTHCKRIYQDKL